MSSPASSYSASHQYLLQRERNSKYYQQFVQNNAFNAFSSERTQGLQGNAAPIRFAPTPTAAAGGRGEERWGGEEGQGRAEPFVNPFRTFDSGSLKVAANQSHLSNYSITENENESYSTLNLYNHSRNQIEPDHELTSSHSTAKLNIEEEPHQPQSLTHDSRQVDRDQDVTRKIDKAAPEAELSVKPYKSEEYGQNVRRTTQNEAKKSHILVEQTSRNQISSEEPSEHAPSQKHSHPKTLQNDAQPTPSSQGQNVESNVYSIPSQGRVEVNHPSAPPQAEFKRTGRANSLNLKYSHMSSLEDEELTTAPAKHLHSSNHTHFYVTPPKGYNFIHHTHIDGRHARYAPKSEPKYHMASSQNVRTNSIQSKNKPVLEHAEQLRETKSHAEANSLRVENDASKLEHSKMTKVLKNDFTSDPLAYDPNTSILYETQTVNVCCGRGDRKDQGTANRINFLPSSQRREDLKSTDPPQSKGILSDQMASFDLAHVSAYQQPKLSNYKINPLHVIKNLHDNPETQHQKKGIQLCGFNPTFLPKRNNPL